MSDRMDRAESGKKLLELADRIPASNSAPPVRTRRLDSWDEIIDVLECLTGGCWVWRGQERAAWDLQTSFERQYESHYAHWERNMLLHFVRRAPMLLPHQMIPNDDDALAWLGLIQHHGGPTRFLDVTRSPYIALFFALEALGDHDRALWAVDTFQCQSACQHTMAAGEGLGLMDCFLRLESKQSELVSCCVSRRPGEGPLFKKFRPFDGVFPVEPWKPDPRQVAQQALFLCAANVERGFMTNAGTHKTVDAFYRFDIPGRLRTEVLVRLARMNVSAATLFPDLSGLARSLRRYLSVEIV